MFILKKFFTGRIGWRIFLSLISILSVLNGCLILEIGKDESCDITVSVFIETEFLGLSISNPFESNSMVLLMSPYKN